MTPLVFLAFALCGMMRLSAATHGAPVISSNTTAELIDVNEVAKLLSCSVRHVFRLADAGKMPAPLRLGACVRWSRAAIMEWIGAGCPSVRAVRGQA